MNIAILGIGHIAEKMAAAISGLDDNYKPYAAASRSIENATRFAKKWRFEKSYGSYNSSKLKAWLCFNALHSERTVNNLLVPSM